MALTDTITNLDEEIKDRNVLEIIGSVEYQLELLNPNGTINHKRDNAKTILFFISEEVETAYPRGITMQQYKSKDAKGYSALLNTLKGSIERFSVQI